MDGGGHCCDKSSGALPAVSRRCAAQDTACKQNMAASSRLDCPHLLRAAVLVHFGFRGFRVAPSRQSSASGQVLREPYLKPYTPEP